MRRRETLVLVAPIREAWTVPAGHRRRRAVSPTLVRGA